MKIPEWTVLKNNKLWARKLKIGDDNQCWIEFATTPPGDNRYHDTTVSLPLEYFTLLTKNFNNVVEKNNVK